jgi:hypothetical protein
MAAVRFAGVHDDGWLAEDCRPDVEEDAVLYRWADLPELLGLDRGWSPLAHMCAKTD